MNEKEASLLQVFVTADSREARCLLNNLPDSELLDLSRQMGRAVLETEGIALEEMKKAVRRLAKAGAFPDFEACLKEALQSRINKQALVSGAVDKRSRRN